MMQELFLVSAGAVTSLGYSLAATTAAFKAGLDNFADSQFVDPHNAPIIAARIERDAKELNEALIKGGVETYSNWALMAIEECLVHAPEYDIKNIQIIFINPEDNTDYLVNFNQLHSNIIEGCWSLIDEHVDADIEELNKVVVNHGVCGIAKALEKAAAWQNGQAGYVSIIVGIDSWINNPAIQRGLSSKRILTSEDSDGFIPAEAASVILLGSVKPNNTEFCVKIKAFSSAQEQAHYSTDEPCYGKGLAKSFKQSLEKANFQPHDIHLRISNISGEEYFFDEASMAWARVLRHPMPDNYECYYPSRNWGEVGLAAGPLLLSHVWMLSILGGHPGQNSLLHFSSVGDLRTSIVTETIKY